jgi:hypothetical protein
MLLEFSTPELGSPALSLKSNFCSEGYFAIGLLNLNRKMNLAAKMRKNQKKKELSKFNWPKNPTPKGER